MLGLGSAQRKAGLVLSVVNQSVQGPLGLHSARAINRLCHGNNTLPQKSRLKHLPSHLHPAPLYCSLPPTTMPAARSKKENSSATPPSDDAHLKVSQSENSKSKRKYVPNARSFSGLSLHNPSSFPVIAPHFVILSKKSTTDHVLMLSTRRQSQSLSARSLHSPSF